MTQQLRLLPQGGRQNICIQVIKTPLETLSEVVRDLKI